MQRGPQSGVVVGGRVESAGGFGGRVVAIAQMQAHLTGTQLAAARLKCGAREKIVEHGTQKR